MNNLDPNKAVINIRAKVKSSDTDGDWTAVCEAQDCEASTRAAKFHGWSTEGWILCPKHKNSATRTHDTKEG